jgi:hypothetical protein
MQSAATATGNGTAIDCTDASSGAATALTMQITGITTATITFEATVDGSNWVAIQFANLNSATAATTATADGLYRATVLGLVQVRARISAYTSGAITIIGILSA